MPKHPRQENPFVFKKFNKVTNRFVSFVAGLKEVLNAKQVNSASLPLTSQTMLRPLTLLFLVLVSCDTVAPKAKSPDQNQVSQAQIPSPPPERAKQLLAHNDLRVDPFYYLRDIKDESGNVVGVMTKADGSRHAVMWVPNL